MEGYRSALSIDWTGNSQRGHGSYKERSETAVTSCEDKGDRSHALRVDKEATRLSGEESHASSQRRARDDGHIS